MLSGWPQPIRATPAGNATCRFRISRLATCRLSRANWPAALASYRASLAIRERLAAADPGNASWQRDLSASEDRIGDVQQAQGDLATALTSYRVSLANAERLAAVDLGNAGWQRDLSVSAHQDWRRAGREGRSRGGARQLPGSHHNIFERLAAADPGNASWQRDLLASQDRIGDVQQAQGDLPAALTSYRASHNIFERLAAADPGNAGWQRDLSVSAHQDWRRAASAGRSAGGARQLPGLP